MVSWAFHGRILPERVPVTVPYLEGCVTSGLGFSYDWGVLIHSSQIVATVTLSDGETDLFTLRNAVVDNIRSLVDLAGYRFGLSLDLEIVSAANRQTNEVFVFGVDTPGISANRGADAGQLSANLLQAVAADSASRLALADFREGMREPAGTGFFCYRAIEALMQSFKHNDRTKDETAWENLRENLAVDRSAITMVQAHASFPRHGRPTVITGQERLAVLQITDKIIGRYLDFIVGARAPLAETQYEILSRPAS